MFLLCGCQQKDNTEDLHSFVEQIKKRKVTASFASILPKVPTPVVYKFDAKTPSPFKSLTSEFQVTPQEKALPLMRFRVSEMSFIGTVMDGGKLAAILLLPDNKFYEVRVGEKIGILRQKIVKIDGKHLELEPLDNSQLLGDETGITKIELKGKDQ